MKQNGLTLEQHQSLSAELKQLRDRLREVREFYGWRSPAGRKAIALADRIDELRCALDDCLFRDCGPERYSPRVYYPGPAAGLADAR